ncbi:hypothetical protein ACFWHR_06630 [Leucobacter sp. NPDC058333]|uniref:hypothetical protein n=1 Tax=Leucobacter sp. NPDC058333 TaxID=3346450 RepID=UPI0036528952
MTEGFAALRARPRPARRRGFVVLAVVAVVVGIVVVIAAIIGIAAERNRPRLVSIEAAGADIMQVDYETSTSQRSETWGSGDRHSFRASGTETTVQVTAEIGHDEPITCTIYIDNEPVMSESSSSDEVTCTYVYPWL